MTIFESFGDFPGSVPYVLADSSGRIVCSGRVPEDMLAIQANHVPEGGALVRGVGMTDTHYVSGGAIVPRLPNPTELRGSVLSNVPVDAVVSIDGTEYPTGDHDTVTLSFPHAGTYTVTVQAFPMQSARFEVHV